VARRERSLKVEIPKPEQDKPELGRVGIIAAVGFAIGVAWPWLADVRLVPAPPNDEVEPAAAPSASVAASAGAPPLSSTSAAPAASAAPPERTAEETTKISPVQVTTCRDEGGKKVKDCDRIGIDDRVRPLLGSLSRCDVARGASQMLSIGMELDFAEKSVTDVFAGKSTTFSKEQAHALVDCVKKDLSGVHLDGIDHEHSRYTIFYFVEFVPPGAAVSPGGGPAEETAEASGLATVSWDVAVVRDEPDTGKIVARLRYGTRVVVTARRGKWYEVKYDAKGEKGWVHRNALGM